MSYQSYIDDNLIVNNLVTEACIINVEDESLRAKSTGWKFKEGEITTIVNLFEQPKDAITNGIIINGAVYMGYKADCKSILAKNGDCGIVLVKSGTSIIIGYYDEFQTLGNVSMAVEHVAFDLRYLNDIKKI
ncbi:hypothetical protein DLAC_11757 [Tieghemostelium lacteum]|uniref:Profilin n=1 Tax=Tieghemostelium lacteum TaxID=361077 RepID=A0A151Z916_TIELA|nr:hypothetical protein DLAC_11757 [Tieghemostelium lacteum]|eukprot:KYQ90445.1 hypothetical protein DLAC_11757 [Tieghemostelium lacteum]